MNIDILPPPSHGVRTITDREAEFRKDLEYLINKYSLESRSNTPDFLLADYLMECLQAFNKGVASREGWYGRQPEEWKAE